jgi:hypothetical protein
MQAYPVVGWTMASMMTPSEQENNDDDGDGDGMTLSVGYSTNHQ